MTCAPGEKAKLDNQELLEMYCKTRDVDLRNDLLQRYLYIAEIVAKKFVNRGVEYDDLFQVASLALLRALERFEPDKGYKFSSFATPTLVGEIKNYFRDRTRMIRISRSDIDLMKRLDSVTVEISQTLHRAPTPEELAEELGVSTEKVLLLLEQRISSNITSLDSTVDDVGDTPLVELLGKDEANYATIENQDFLKRVMDTLDDTSRYIIEQRFFQNKSQREVARTMNVSQMYISRTERKLLQKFRAILEE